MSQAEDLLNSLSEEELASYSSGGDGRSYFTIDENTRTISTPPGFVALGVESDEKTERVWFKCPRIVGDNIDITTLHLRVNFRNANGTKSSYLVEDAVVEGEYVIFSWEIRRVVTMYKGEVSFIVCAVKTVPGTDRIANEWNTTPCKARVLEGLEVENPVIDESANDTITQLLTIMDNRVEEVEGMTEEVRAMKASIEGTIGDVGNIETALDNIIAIQDELLGVGK